MKRLLALLLAVIMVTSMVVTVSASELNQTPGSTTLTTTVPAATYTLNIPADTTVEFGKEITGLGNVTVTNSGNFAKGKNLEVTVAYDAFKPDLDSISTTIPFSLKYSTVLNGYLTSASDGKASGGAFVFRGRVDGTVSEQAVTDVDINGKETYVTQLGVYVSSTNWGKALAGNYTATISFTSEVVVEE